MKFDWGRDLPPARRGLALLWGLILLAAVLDAGHRAWISDDAFITMRYCDQLLAGNGPVYNPGERVEGYTHFLWFILLAIGHIAHLDAEFLGRYAALPVFAAGLFLLVRISGRLFPGRGGVWGAPVAAVAWALHEDARWFASGGLETAAFTATLLLAFDLLTLSRRPQRGALAGWALAVAWLLRPDAALYFLLGVAYLATGGRESRRLLRDFVGVWLLLAGAHFVFRLLYYGAPLPNPYYAKSGGRAYWPQGLVYLQTYFRAYFVLLLALPGLALVAFDSLRRRRRPETSPLLYAAVAAVATAVYVTRVGGDFMFARLFLPTTPFMLLLVESLVHRLPRVTGRALGTVAVCGLVIWGVIRKHQVFGDHGKVYGIVDEPTFYPFSRLVEIRDTALSVRECLAGTDAVVLVKGGQAMLAYYARFPVAIEQHGLTDAHIAHAPVEQRGRPGHEKNGSPEYLCYERRVNLRFHYSQALNVPQYTLFGLERITGDILVYDRDLMEKMKRCHGARFLDFPLWLLHDYIPTVAGRRPDDLRADWVYFQQFYFDHNPDGERLRDQLRAALEAAGVRDLPPTRAEGGQPIPVPLR